MSRHAHRPRRFLFVVSRYPPHGRGGAELATRRLAEAITRRGHLACVLAGTGGERPSRRIERGVRVLRVLDPLAIGPLWGATYMLQVAWWSARLSSRIDWIVSTKIYLHTAVAVLVARGTGIRCAASTTSGVGPGGELDQLRSHRGGRLLESVALRADAIFFQNGGLRRELADAGVSGERLHWLPQIATTRPLVIERQAALFLFVGRLVPVKNTGLLLEAFARVVSSHPAARLRILGEGPEESRLRALAAELDIANAVEFAGWCDDPGPHYSESIATIVTSRSEGGPNTVPESMAAGTPVIATDVGFVREYLDIPPDAPVATSEPLAGEGGLLVASGVEAIAVAMRSLIDDPALWNRLSSQAVARVAGVCTEDAVVRRFLDALGED